MKIKTVLIALSLAALPAAVLADQPAGKAKGANAAKGGTPTTGVLPDDRVLAKKPPASADTGKSSGAPAGKAKGAKPTAGVLPDDRVLAKPPAKASAK